MSSRSSGAPVATVSSAAAHVAPGGPTYALLAYGIWGVAPVYFVWVGAALPFEILAHRVLWSIPLLALLLTVSTQWRVLFGLSSRALGALFISGSLIAANWGVFIWAVSHENILETSLGYYLNPLINVLFGVLLLRERMRWGQWLAVGLAASAVANEVWQLGTVPWYGLLLAVTFALYGLVRKVTAVGPIVGLAVETTLIAPFALSYLLWLHAQGLSATAVQDIELLGMLAVGGLVTIVPLLCFNAAALRMPLSILGFFQYIAPTLALLIAVFVYEEPFRSNQAVTFGLIWLALLLFSVEGWLHSRGGSKG